MITKELLKTEIEKVQDEYLEVLFKIIKAFELSAKTHNFDQITSKKFFKNDTALSWHKFIKATYGCLADDPILSCKT
ncbi:MAG: hypothetical protein K8R68_00685 [Bacteroidales bacterium]|nr:hypothetical protein [Bacteroidales bacterium]